MIRKTDGSAIPQNLDECTGLDCETCAYKNTVEQKRISGYLLYLPMTCQVRHLLKIEDLTRGVRSRKGLINAMTMVEEETQRRESEKERTEQTKQKLIKLLKEEGKVYKVLGSIRGRLIFIDTDKTDVWWKPKYERTENTQRLGWMTIAICTAKYDFTEGE